MISFFKFSFAFISVGGATFAFIKFDQTPFWLKMVSLILSTVMLIEVLPTLPSAIDAMGEAARRIDTAYPTVATAIEDLRRRFNEKSTSKSVVESLPSQVPPVSNPLPVPTQETTKGRPSQVWWGALFNSQVQRCWTKPAPPTGVRNAEAAFAVRLKANGTLDGLPVPEKQQDTAYLRAYQESGYRAIIACQPYHLPAESFEEWKYFAPVFSEVKN